MMRPSATRHTRSAPSNLGGRLGAQRVPGCNDLDNASTRRRNGATPGPLQSVELHDGGSAPFYALRFDAEGRTMGPETQQCLIDALDADTFTDVYLFSHGWNNDWDTALRSYFKFTKTFRDMISSRGLDFGRDYRPLLAGVFLALGRTGDALGEGTCFRRRRQHDGRHRSKTDR